MVCPCLGQLRTDGMPLVSRLGRPLYVGHIQKGDVHPSHVPCKSPDRLEVVSSELGSPHVWLCGRLACFAIVQKHCHGSKLWKPLLDVDTKKQGHSRTPRVVNGVNFNNTINPRLAIMYLYSRLEESCKMTQIRWVFWANSIVHRKKQKFGYNHKSSSYQLQ